MFFSDFLELILFYTLVSPESWQVAYIKLVKNNRTFFLLPFPQDTDLKKELS